MNKIRVVLISQQSLLCQGIRHLFSDIEDLEVSSVVGDNEEVLSLIDALLPNVSVVDIDGHFENSIVLARRIKQRSPNIGIIMLSSNPNDEQIFQAMKASAAAYLDKDIDANDLVRTIRRVAQGEHPINDCLADRPKLAEQVLSEFQELYWRSEAGAYSSPLTLREIEILDYIAQGYFNKQIAVKLGISEQTIKNHVTSILRKLNVNARTEAVVVAIKKGLISVT